MAESEDQDSKTEDPTPRKLMKLREDGNVPHSREVNNLFAMLGLALVLGLVGPWSMTQLGSLFAAMLQNAGAFEMEDGPSIGYAMRTAFESGLLALAPILLVMLVIAVAGGLVQNGLIFSGKPLEMDLGKLSIIQGFGRIFGLKSVVEMLKGLVKLAVIGSAVGALVWGYKEQFVAMAGMALGGTLGLGQQIALACMGAILGIMALLALGDFLFQRFQYYKQHRMSRQELKDEFKESEGDPFVKQRQRQIRRERASKRMMSAVPQASVVVTNPTHYSVALRYKPNDGDAAPVVVAKGVDMVAMRIREIAKEANVPIYEDPPLARQLFANVEIDQTIPVVLFEAVAKVIAFVAKLKKAA